MAEETPRDKLLLQMYDQLFNDINRHIIVAWQAVSVVIGTFAVLALVEKQVISLDVGASLILLVCGWLLATLFDSSYWYNRNLVMIANIERQYLTRNSEHDDAREIHYYFTAHRPENRMIGHLKIQVVLGVSVAAIVLLMHLFSRVVSGFGAPIAAFEPLRALPYVVAVAAAWWVQSVKRHGDTGYREFVSNSPGIAVPTDGLAFGAGHGFKAGESPK